MFFLTNLWLFVTTEFQLFFHLVAVTFETSFIFLLALHD